MDNHRARRAQAYREGAYAGLQKLGFTALIPTEDLPDFLHTMKQQQLRALYRMSAAAGTPAGGLLVELPIDYES